MPLQECDARERAVWERVRAGRTETESGYLRQEVPPREEDTSCNGPDPKQLLAWICHEYEDACLYRHLARCLPACARRCLLELAAEEQCHARRLSAHYYAMTGRCAQVQTQYQPRHCPLEILRCRYQEELDGAAQYMDAAHSACGAISELLEELSRDEARHSRSVMNLLECVL